MAKKSNLILVIIILIVLAIYFLPKLLFSIQGTWNLQADEDSYIDSQNFNINYGSAAELLLETNSPSYKLAYFKFYPSQQAPWASNCEFTTITANIAEVGTFTSGRDYELYSGSINWEENSITYMNAPVPETLLATATSDGGFDLNFQSTTLQNYITQKILANEGFTLIVKSASTAQNEIRSKESSLSDKSMILREDSGFCCHFWQCSEWSTCTNHIQTRTCTDTQNCAGINGKPAASQLCGCNTLADTNCDNKVSRAELGTFINKWIAGTATRTELGNAIISWVNS